jgi:hypothetical protein
MLVRSSVATRHEMALEIDDIEFERLLERMINLWPKYDTFMMAKILKTSEANVAYVLSCMMEGSYDCSQEEVERVTNGDRD